MILGLDSSSSDAGAESTCSTDNGNGDDTEPCSKLMGGSDGNR